MVWVFGYGSIIWKPDFPFSRSLSCYAKGYKRVWWQGSTDHRGVPGAPGRTVTLEERPGSIVWGRAFEIEADDWEGGVREDLAVREKQYDTLRKLDLHARGSSGSEEIVAVRGALTWIATPRSENYLGPLPMEELASQIATSRGPSGPNSEFLLSLAGPRADPPELFEGFAAAWRGEARAKDAAVVHGLRDHGTAQVDHPDEVLDLSDGGVDVIRDAVGVVSEVQTLGDSEELDHLVLGKAGEVGGEEGEHVRGIHTGRPAAHGLHLGRLALLEVHLVRNVLAELEKVRDRLEVETISKFDGRRDAEREREGCQRGRRRKGVVGGVGKRKVGEAGG